MLASDVLVGGGRGSHDSSYRIRKGCSCGAATPGDARRRLEYYSRFPPPPPPSSRLDTYRDDDDSLSIRLAMSKC
ncbi:unnamed protein product [Acanthoscelides obtectus]|uniref:Uncharacterized protein n=1 Tax=Acanthoscelides obtectus TaxID=200917 RepID=A0A9P0QC91_ACAOB|nr:unnamed protein product [Acanthoscelides obtectus]CAK1682973.1 hypothetical protein AOBTE_LOCUS34025 [Acanthoscelides obtectus]